MNEALEPLRASKLTEQFVSKFEDLILSGRVAVGERLPSERELATRLSVSRPVVHEGLVELAARGLVTIQPRVGTVVNDYRREGSLALLGSLLRFQGSEMEPALLEGLLAARRLLGRAAAHLAAQRRSEADLATLHDIVDAEPEARDVETVVALDFAFHHAVAVASGNPVFAMLVKSFEPASRALTTVFYADLSRWAHVLPIHARIYDAILRQDGDKAVELVTRLLDHGRSAVLGKEG